MLETLKCCSGVQLKSIYLDECCKLRRLYQGIFVDVPVKLALLHAAQHVTSSIPKGTKLSKQISKGFGLIFRENGDLNESHSLSTPESSIIMNNLEIFLERWKNVFNELKLDKTCTK